MTFKHICSVPGCEPCGHEIVKSTNLSKLHAFDVFESYEVFALSIGVVYALVVVIYFCKNALQNYTILNTPKQSDE